MIDYSVFDSLFDSVIVIDQDRKILYCNEAAAALAGSSVRRLTKGVVFSDIYQLSEPDLFPMSGGSIGREESAPMQELSFTVKNSEKTGKLQVTIQPFAEGQGDKRWVMVMHDVTLEETLHVKYQGELEQKEGYIRDLQIAKAQLEDYSANLEKKVEERTVEVRQANRMLNAIMNSLGQGFLVFDAKGICSDIFTRACEDILEGIPAQKPIWEVLKLDQANTDQFKMWMQAVLAESLPFESLADLAPDLFHHSQARHIPLNFYPIRSEEGSITNIVMVATDRTREHQAEEALLKEQQYIQMVLKVIKSRDQFGLFLESAKNLIDKIKSDLNKPEDTFNVAEALRTLHTLEGEAGLFSAATIRQKARDCQEVLEPIKRGDIYDLHELLTELKVQVEQLEQAYGEFLRAHRDLLEILKVGKSRNIEVSVTKLLGFAKMLDESSSLPRLRERFSEDLLKQPISLYIQHFNEIAQHVAQIQGKQLEPVQFNCQNVKIAPGSIDPLIASMVHVFRNAVDHGIEDPATRMEKGKPEAGKIIVEAEKFDHNGQSWVRLCVKDDGNGIDPVKLREKLVQKYPNDSFQGQTDEQVIQGIFLPGFSSRESVGQFSGRGIGMDAVKTEVVSLGGKIWVESKLGMGTRLVIEFPEVAAVAVTAKSA